MANLSNALKFIKHNSFSPILVSRSEVIENSVTIHNAKLHPYMYDATTISIQNISELSPGDAGFLRRCKLTIKEILGEQRELTVNLGTRLDDDGNLVGDSVFFDENLSYDSETDRYELNVYIPAKCSDGDIVEGFDDSVVVFEAVLTSPVEDVGVPASVVGQYVTTLPPVIVQGKADKSVLDAEDQVFPYSADRCSIGEGTIPSYYENSCGYSSDYLFTNSSPEYRVLTSGFIPESLDNEVQFSEVSGYMYDDVTESVNYLPTEQIELKKNLLLPVMTKFLEEPVTSSGTFDVTVWKTVLASEWARTTTSTIKNVVTVSASIDRL